ncbi:ATP-binding cassette domain-containing protein [Streptomyces boncukensis]|uniref:ATP-binding cassette domain-containing protein n=1 Tax=Streptomyces boncukensis TaxID=2711219 RepID=A0A6G4X4A6_9ACTN|nr:ATP-binding cassette domain-containing protein [Streptomyces boncukensis]
MAEEHAEHTGHTEHAGHAVAAEGLGLRGPRGPVFEGITFTAPPGSLIALEGPSGSGRTCLLLTLTGRMKPTAGRAEVYGHRLPKRLAAVRRISALGSVPGVTDLDPALTVTEQLRERVLLQRRFSESVRALLRPRRERAAASRARLEGALGAVGLDLDALPRRSRTAVRDLGRLDELRLSLALALLGDPLLLAVDDAEVKLSDGERAEMWALLRSLAGTGRTVLASCAAAPPEGALVVRTAPRGEDTDDGTGTGTGNETNGGAADALAEASRA